MTTKSERSSIVLLDEASAGQAMIHLKDGEKFLVAIADAARACKAVPEFGDFSQQFTDLLERLDAWIHSHLDSIKAAYLTVRENDLLFVVMQREVPFDAELTEALTELDLEIANGGQFPLIDMEVLAIPAVSEGSAKAFLSSGKLFTYAK